MKVLLELNNIRKAYGARVILDGASVSLSDDQKVGVIGRNGAGKSTLCRIITGHEEADGGTVNKSAGFRLAYLEQLDPYRLDETVIDFLQRYTGKEDWQCGKVAGSFQLKHDLLTAEIGSLPGGYRTRVKLASMLLTDPNFLIMDEPTNYLDLKTLMLFEEFLQDFRGGFMVVSHDREFLMRTCTHTLDIERGDCTLYPGTVEDYLIFKEEQKEQVLSYNKNVEAKQRQLNLFITRFGAKASKATQAKSKAKQLARLKTIEVGHALGNVSIRIPAVEKQNKDAISCRDLAIGYPGKLVASKINMEILHGKHVAVLGDNGQGKTTFLRTIAGDLEPKGGTFKWGHGLEIGYYAQHVFTALDSNSDVYTHLENHAAPGVSRQDILNLAGSFLFKGDDVKKKISVLSGGERARVCLASLLLAKRQVLIFDEPTNHLDFETVEALGRALKTFAGTVFFVSHDRTFVNLVATEIIEVHNGAVRRHAGNYEDYVYHLEKRIQEELKTGIVAGDPSVKNHGKNESHPVRPDEDLRKEQRKISSRIRKIEERLELQKKKRDAIQQEFTAAGAAWSRERNERYAEIEQSILDDENLWIELNSKLEK